MNRFIVIVNNELFVKKSTPADADPVEGSHHFGRSITDAFRFRNRREAMYYAKLRWPGKREVLEVEQ